jgi:two-component system, OmpR family, response regulator
MSPQPPASLQAALPHVLNVDNDPTVRSLLVDYLGQNELRVTAVADSRSMEAVLAQQVVDLVVLEPKLKHEDGMVLARNLRIGVPLDKSKLKRMHAGASQT